MLNDEIIGKLAEETVESFGDLDEGFRSELFEAAKKTIETEYRKRILKDLNYVAVSKLDEYLRGDVETNLIPNNSVASFIELNGQDIEGTSVGEVYLWYSVYCREHDKVALSKIAFSKEIQKHTDLISKTTSINGRSIRIFTKRSSS